MKVGIIEIIDFIIVFQLLAFSIFLFVRLPRKLSNYLLGAQLVSQSAGIFAGFCYAQSEFFLNNTPWLLFAGYPFLFLWGPTFYLYVKSAAFSNFKLSPKQLVHFIPFLVILIYLAITFFPLTAEEKKFLLGHNTSYLLFRFYPLVDFFIRTQVLFYIILSLSVLSSLKKEIKDRFSSISETNYSWIKFIVYGFTAAYILSAPLIIWADIFKTDRYLIAFESIFIYTVYFNFIFFKAWYQPDIFSISEDSVKYKASKLTKEEAAVWIKKIEEFISNRKPYLNPNLTINQLAEDIQMQSRVLSQIINVYYRQNFQDYINKLRIEESKKYLLDQEDRKTVLEILYGVGFNTKSSFNIAFKKTTGLTPTEFKKRYQEKIKPETSSADR